MQNSQMMAQLELPNLLSSLLCGQMEHRESAVKVNASTIAQHLQSQPNVSKAPESQQPRSPRSSAKKNISNDTAKNLKAQQAAQLRLFECSKGSYRLLPDTGVSVFGTA